MIGEALTDAGCEAVVSPAAELRYVAGAEAVTVAGGLYANRWHRDARRSVRRNRAALQKLPLWLVSSGPLDDSAGQHDIPPTSQVRKLAAAVGARSHVTFAGRLTPDAKGFPATAMVKRSAATGATRRTSAAG